MIKKRDICLEHAHFLQDDTRNLINYLVARIIIEIIKDQFSMKYKLTMFQVFCDKSN